jgi:hypothetical protein
MRTLAGSPPRSMSCSTYVLRSRKWSQVTQDRLLVADARASLIRAREHEGRAATGASRLSARGGPTLRDERLIAKRPAAVAVCPFAGESETGRPEISEACPLLFRLELPAGEACCSFASQRPRLTAVTVRTRAATRCADIHSLIHKGFPLGRLRRTGYPRCALDQPAIPPESSGSAWSCRGSHQRLAQGQPKLVTHRASTTAASPASRPAVSR